MTDNRLGVLDGWRGISIALVLAGHLFPLGPKFLQLNGAVAAAGMVIFFILSGFLITNLLLRDGHIGNFLIRRLLRILPLAWLVLGISFLITHDNANVWWRHFTLTANLEPPALVPATSHFWSLCVEMQFYLGIAALVAIAGQRALWILPILAVAITVNRVTHDALLDINTLRRVDEILAGCTLALLFHRHKNGCAQRGPWIHPLWIAPILVLASHPAGGWLNYWRPYLALWMVGSTLFVTRADLFTRMLQGRVLRYLATVSYAVYVIHGGLRETWLASGDSVEKYMKRPLFLLVTFGLAHVSTFHFERFFTDWGKRISHRKPSA